MALPPLQVTQQAVKENRFSQHDNRHAFQNYGVYFGQGLGKRPVSRMMNQHNSDNHTSWVIFPPDSRTRSTYHSDFSPSLSLPPLSTTKQQDPVLLEKFQVFSKSTFRRFPRSHPRPPSLPSPPPLSIRTSWFPHEHQSENRGESCKVDSSIITTPLVVIAESQKPFLPHNPWVYSYRS